ncbi:Hypothetical_protein [Hexamita inflata]|uniref:Hypothetical_protein n=1 Tax=Hexamita inflata TaxID=28002 RepID=A0AA86NF96_9EUKA|nr:Hypothetical protein HINF_LOCUS6100 [Hexamita inflata]
MLPSQIHHLKQLQELERKIFITQRVVSVNNQRPRASSRSSPMSDYSLTEPLVNLRNVADNQLIQQKQDLKARSISTSKDKLKRAMEQQKQLVLQKKEQTLLYERELSNKLQQAREAELTQCRQKHYILKQYQAEKREQNKLVDSYLKVEREHQKLKQQEEVQKLETELLTKSQKLANLQSLRLSKSDL